MDELSDSIIHKEEIKRLTLYLYYLTTQNTSYFNQGWSITLQDDSIDEDKSCEGTGIIEEADRTIGYG